LTNVTNNIKNTKTLCHTSKSCFQGISSRKWFWGDLPQRIKHLVKSHIWLFVAGNSVYCDNVKCQSGEICVLDTRTKRNKCVRG